MTTHPVIAKYREVMRFNRDLGGQVVIVGIADLAALLDIAETAMVCVASHNTVPDGCPCIMCESLARLGGNP